MKKIITKDHLRHLILRFPALKQFLMNNFVASRYKEIYDLLIELESADKAKEVPKDH